MHNKVQVKTALLMVERHPDMALRSGDENVEGPWFVNPAGWCLLDLPAPPHRMPPRTSQWTRLAAALLLASILGSYLARTLSEPQSPDRVQS